MTVSVGANQLYVEGVFGGPTEELDGEVSAGTTAVKVVGNDPEALSLTIINLGSAVAYLMFDDQVSATRGIELADGGGFLNVNVRDDQGLPTREWWAIAASGTTDLFYIRTRRYTLTYPGEG